MNATAEKFGYPKSLLKEYQHWAVLMRPAQVTLGSLVLVCREPVAHFGEISESASRELGQVVSAIEAALGKAFSFDRINYLMLMMVDPDVHFHVLPRYEGAREFAGTSYQDEAWPGPPDVTSKLSIGDDDLSALRDHLETFF